MFVMHSQKDRKLAPAKDTRKDIHRISPNPHKKSWPTAEVSKLSQGKRRVRGTACHCAQGRTKLTILAGGADFSVHIQ